MSASSPRKAPARKASPKKAVPRTAEKKIEDNVAMLEEYRERAAKTNFIRHDRTTKPYLVRGFEPPIEIKRPDLKKQILLDKLLRSNRINDAIELFCGEHYDKIVDAFSAFDDGDALLFGMFDEMVEHFNGPGANDVPGGLPGLVDLVGGYGAALRADLHHFYHLDLNEWLVGERDWRELFELKTYLKTGSAYLAAVREDEELAALLAGQPKPDPPDSPPFYEFSAERYDFAEMKNLMQAILIAAQRGDPSRANLEPQVPIPAIDKFRRTKRQTRLMAVVALITGEEA